MKIDAPLLSIHVVIYYANKRAGVVRATEEMQTRKPTNWSRTDGARKALPAGRVEPFCEKIAFNKNEKNREKKNPVPSLMQEYSAKACRVWTADRGISTVGGTRIFAAVVADTGSERFRRRRRVRPIRALCTSLLNTRIRWHLVVAATASTRCWLAPINVIFFFSFSLR